MPRRYGPPRACSMCRIFDIAIILNTPFYELGQVTVYLPCRQFLYLIYCLTVCKLPFLQTGSDCVVSVRDSAGVSACTM